MDDLTLTEFISKISHLKIVLFRAIDLACAFSQCGRNSASQPAAQELDKMLVVLLWLDRRFDSHC